LVGLDADVITDLLVKRENESSTVVAPGVAIPHVIIDGDQPVALLVARCREGGVSRSTTRPPVNSLFIIIGAHRPEPPPAHPFRHCQLVSGPGI
jgi:APA family basic amino acid/polyamine antiporter